MKILFDQGTPVPLRAYLIGHQVETAYERGWATLENGALLDAAQTAGFDILITTDQNLRYQQDLATRQIAVVVLRRTVGHGSKKSFQQFWRRPNAESPELSLK